MNTQKIQATDDATMLSDAISMAPIAKNGRLVAVETDGELQLLELLLGEDDPSLICNLIHAGCSRSFEDIARKMSAACLRAGVSLCHVVNSTEHGVLAMREEYQ